MSDLRIEFSPADKVKVFDLVEHLRKAFEAFFQQNATLQPHTYSNVDILMAAHNFHKLVVEQLASESPHPNIIFAIASTTFARAMREEQAKGQP